MRLRSVEFKGLTRFAETKRIDFETFGPGLVALVGENGAGKTTVLESAFASLYKSMATRPGSLYNYCRGSDASIVSRWSDEGRSIMVVLKIDVERKRTEGYVQVDGIMTTDGKSGAFAEAIDRHFGSSSMFLASVLSAQNKAGNFLEMKRVERKELFAELLMLGHYQALHQTSHEKETEGVGEVKSVRELIAAIQADPQIEEALKMEEQLMRERIGDASVQLVVKRKDLTEAARICSDHETTNERIGIATKMADGARGDLELEQKIAAEAAKKPNEIRAAAESKREALRMVRAGDLEERAIHRHHVRALELEGEIKDLQARIDNAGDLESVKSDIAELEMRIRQANDRRATQDKRVAELSLKQSGLDKKSSAIDSIQAELDQLNKLTDVRDNVPCAGVSIAKIAPPGVEPSDYIMSEECPLLGHANEAAPKVIELDKQANDLAEEMENLEAEIDTEEESISSGGRQYVADGLSIERNEKKLGAAKNDLAVLISLVGSSEEMFEKIDAKVVANTNQFEEESVHAAGEIARVLFEKGEVDEQESSGLSSAAEAIERQESVVAEAKREYASTFGDLQSLRAEAPSDSLIASAREDLSNVQSDIGRLENGFNVDKIRLAVVTRDLEHSAANRDRVDGLEVKIDRALVSGRDWGMLATALGREGIQALEIDAAGPEIAALVNNLLDACYGPRFSITFETLREKKSAPGEYTEAFDVHVYDGGHRRPFEALSGGEGVIVSEAISLAISIYHSRKSRIQYETLWRDETAGALDPKNAMKYILMLRRALELGSFYQIIFIAQSPDVYAAADYQIVLDTETNNEGQHHEEANVS